MVVLVIRRGFVLVSLVCIVGSNGYQCGQRKSTQEIVGKRIIGGTEAIHGSWPWMAMLTLNGKYKCGGSIIATRAVLTAAHCVYGLSKDKDKLEVIVGKHHKTTVDETEQSFLVESVVIRRDYNHTLLVHDIALLILQESLTYTRFIQPVCLPSTSITFDKGIVLGWGETKGSGYEDVLKEVRANVSKSRAFCLNRLKVKSRTLLERNFCAGSAKQDACYGDSGGPFNSEQHGHWYVTGFSNMERSCEGIDNGRVTPKTCIFNGTVMGRITATFDPRIVSTGLDCAQPGHPGIYVNVSTYFNWITVVLANNNLTV